MVDHLVDVLAVEPVVGPERVGVDLGTSLWRLSKTSMRTQDYRLLIDQVLSRYDLTPEQLEIVESVRDWSIAHGHREDSHDRPARCFRSHADGTFHIVMAAEITEGMFAGIEGRMLCDGFAEELEALETDEDRLVHLLLHEIAADRLSTGEQAPRDEWAFAELARTKNESR